jgi:hypothetical protein
MNPTERHNLYRSKFLAAIPRLLSGLDRDPFSSTYGSFDREYWAWATKDFSNVDLQRAIYPLTVLYLQSFQGNVWYRQPRVKDWILAACQYWRQTQHKNGSHDHHYPNEFSFVGVAFPLYEIAESYRLLRAADELDAEEQAQWLPMMTRGAEFLCRIDEIHGFISNHRIGAACALTAMHRITGEARFQERAAELIAGVLAMASKEEGWPYEYGGADPGYQTLATYYLANYIRLTGGNDEFNRLAEASVGFLQYFIHPDGSIGGEYGSRNCPLFFPSGLELMAKHSSTAEAIAGHGAHGVASGNTPGLADADIRNFIPLLSSYAQAMMVSAEGGNAAPAALPISRCFERFWPDAGLFIRSDALHYTVVGCTKGGVIKVFDKAQARLVASHAGYMARSRQGRHISTQFQVKGGVRGLEDCVGSEIEPVADRQVNLTQQAFCVVHNRTASPGRMLLFRLFTLSIGRNLWLATWIKLHIITALFIHRRRSARLSLARTISFSSEGPAIEDQLQGRDMNRLTSLRAGDIFTTIYMASSKYYRHQEMMDDELSNEELVDLPRKNDVLTLIYRLSNGRLVRQGHGGTAKS